MDKFIFFIEGQDRTGKDTLVKKLAQTFYHWKPMVMHCYGTKTKGPEGEKLSFAYYSKYLKLVTQDSTSWILNRTHLGENVYAPIYRNYPGGYVYGLEGEYGLDKRDDCFLITLVDSSGGAFNRDDMNSLSSGDESKYIRETEEFIDLTKRSSIKNKLLIDIKDKTIEDVHRIVFDWIGDRIK